MERPLAQVKCTMYCSESLIQFYMCNVKKVFNTGSWSLYPLLIFSTSFWLEEGLMFSCKKSHTSPLIAPINFMKEQGLQ